MLFGLFVYFRLQQSTSFRPTARGGDFMAEIKQAMSKPGALAIMIIIVITAHVSRRARRIEHDVGEAMMPRREAGWRERRLLCRSARPA